MHIRAIPGLIALGAVWTVRAVAADGTVSTYLRDGWEIKAASQVSSTGRTQVILQKGNQGMVCTIYYSVTENGWIPQGCDPLP